MARRTNTVRRRSFLKAAAGTSGALVLAGCTGDGGDGGGTEPSGTESSGGGGTVTSGGTKTVHLGQVIPLTGAAKLYGLPGNAGQKMAVEDINGDGGFEVGGTTYKFEYTALDSECKPATARNAASRLIQDRGVDVIYSGNCPSSILAWVDMAIDSETFTVLDQDQASKLHAKAAEHDFVFGTSPVIYNEKHPLISFVAAEGAYIVNELGHEKIAFLTPKSQYGFDVQKYVAKTAKTAGAEVVKNVNHPIGASDFSNAITTFKSTDADIIISSSFPNSFWQFLKQAGEKGLREQAQIFATQGPTEGQADRLVSDQVADGFYSATLGLEVAQQASKDGDLPGAPAERGRKLKSRFGEEYPDRPWNSSFLVGYENVQLLKKAIEKSGGADKGSLVEGFEALTWSDVSDFTTQYYIPPKGSIDGAERQGKLFDDTHQLFFQQSIQKWDMGKKKYHELLELGPYWK
ncbi:MAG: ABC transporter substrate-binding protein [Haloarculaceae archaeon]